MLLARHRIEPEKYLYISPKRLRLLSSLSNYNPNPSLPQQYAEQDRPVPASPASRASRRFLEAKTRVPRAERVFSGPCGHRNPTVGPLPTSDTPPSSGAVVVLSMLSAV